MDNIQLDGVYSFMDNIKTIKLGDPIKLIINSNNKISKKAVGVYTIDNKKIGYLPFTCDQIDINNKFFINKICLNKLNLQILISCEYNKVNIISIEEYINDTDLYINDNEIFKIDIIKLKKKLSREGFDVNNIRIIFINEYFINILIEIINNNQIEKSIYYTVTKKYYDENVFLYDEFYKYKLIKNNIYELFTIHRLEFYIIKNYKLLNKTINKINLNNFNVNINILKISEYNIEINEIKNNNLCYDHELKIYFYINLYSDKNSNDSIIEFNNDLNHSNLDIMKSIISNKKYIIYNSEYIKKIEIFNISIQ